MDDNFERRFSTLAPRVLGDDEIKDAKKGQPVLSGHCARFFDPADADGTQFMLAKNLVERINPHAFDEAITSNADCVALFNHDQNQLLARRAAGTLHLAVDRQGLRYTISPNRVLAPFLIESVRRGDLRGASFAFTVNSQRFVAGTGGGPDIREILSCSLHDISVVASPAYAATSVSVNLRSVHGYDSWRLQRERFDADAERERVRHFADMRRRLAEADAESRRLESAEKRRQLDRIEADMRDERTNVMYPVSDELLQRAKAINKQMWAFENETL